MENESQRGMVWIVEDSPLEAEMARRALAPTQDSEVVADGSLVLERIAAGARPDVIVLDWQLPGVSGVEVCRVLRQTHDANALPVLMLTVQGRKQDVAFAIEAGANDYVTKPYDPAELVARVQTLMRTTRLQRAQVRRARQLELAANVGAALTRAQGVDDVALRCSQIVATRFEATFAGVWMNTGDDLVIQGHVGDATVPGMSDLVWDCARARHVASRGSVTAVPLLVREAIVGVLAVVALPSPETPLILSSIADLVALGVARARAETERAEILERERIAREDAEAANRSKDDFLAIVSHELRTPLNAITGWAAMLNGGTLDPTRTKRAIETIERNARAQKQLIEDLLDVTRIASGKLRIERGRIDVASSIEMAVESVRLAADNKGLDVKAYVEPHLPVVMGDADRVQQVVTNLLSNAIKFTPQGGSVVLRAAVASSAIEISVTDTGRGISPEFLPHVFERFRQADGSATRTSGGLGLGLAIASKLVELHGGSIEAYSDGVGLGARFVVTLPVAAERPIAPRSSTELDPRATGRHGAMAARPELEGLRVLVVDDEPDARDLMKTLLELYGIQVTTSASAAEAFDTLRATTQDVLLSDVAMPMEDGLSLIRRVRQLPASEGGRVPAVALTAYARAEDRQSAIDAGFTTHVTKPINANDLFGVLASLAPKASDAR